MKRLTVLGLLLLPLMVVVFTLTLAPSQPLQAKSLLALEFDPTYGGQGVADQPAFTAIKDLVRLEDGSLLAVGKGSFDASTPLIRVAKFTPAGLPDMSFGTEGVASGTLPFGFITTVAIATDSQNRIIVLVGRADVEASEIVLLRFLGNGDIDTTFGNQGIVVFETSIYQGRGYDVSVLADNRVLALVKGMPSTRLYGFTASGDLDVSFGTDGALSPPTDIVWRKILVDSDNRIVVAGATSDAGFMTLWRYTANGTPDATFGTNGQSSPLFAEVSMGYDVVQSTMERYVVSGARRGPFKADGYAVARTSEAGELDPTFSEDGRWSYDFDPTIYMDDTVAERVFVDAVGTITVAGSKWRQPRLVQILSDGTLNTAFGINGVTKSLWSGFQLLSDSERSGGLVGDTAGGLYVGGILSYAGIQKFTALGEPDFSFGTKGWSVFGSIQNVKVAASTQQPDGKTVLAFSVHGDPYRYATRLLADGTPDMEFGTDGVVTLPTGSTALDERICDSSSGLYCTQVEVDLQGRILVLIDSTLVRLLANGTVDSTFATNGVWQLPSGTFHFGLIPRFGVQSTSHIVISGPFSEGTTGYTKVIRLLPSGVVDTTFGTNGAALLDSCIKSRNTGLLTIQPDDKIIRNELDCRYENPLIPVHRLTPNGQPDLTFGTAGTSTLPALATGSQVLPDGKILFYGMRFQNGENLIAIMRVTQNGLLDTTFGTDGIQAVPLLDEAIEGNVSHLVLDPYNGILLLGTQKVITPQSQLVNRFLALRLHVDGTVDSSFGANGYYDLPSAYGVSQITGASYTNGRIIISYLSQFSPNEVVFVEGLRFVSDSPLPTATATATSAPATATPILPTGTPVSPTMTPISGTATATPPTESFTLFLPLVRRN